MLHKELFPIAFGFFIVSAVRAFGRTKPNPLMISIGAGGRSPWKRGRIRRPHRIHRRERRRARSAAGKAAAEEKRQCER